MFNAIKKNNGVIALEASIVLSLFIFLVLFLYSFFLIYEANGVIKHAITQSALSLSLDSYATKQLNYHDDIEGSGEEGHAGSLNDLFTLFLLDVSVKDDKYVSTDPWFADTTKDDWYKGETAPEVLEAKKGVVEGLCQTRTFAYMTKKGDKASANELLTKLNVIGGTEGLDFTGSGVDDSGNITVKVNYKVKFIFNFSSFGINELEFTQSSTSRMW